MSLKNVISAVNSKKAIPHVDLVGNRPEIPAAISKLILDPNKSATYDNKGNRTISTTTSTDFVGISNDIAARSRDAETIAELFPDMELSAQILISSILSPKDMMNTELNFILQPGLKVSEISAPLIAELKEYCIKDYKIEPLLPTILRRMLFESGSYPVAVIPESSIDSIINGPGVAKESIMTTLSGYSDLDTKTFKSIGILGPSVKDGSNSSSLKASLESLDGRGYHDLNLASNKIAGLEVLNSLVPDISTQTAVTDNYNLLKLPFVFERLKETTISRIVGKAAGRSVGNENFTKLSDSSLTNLVYKNPNRNSTNIIKIKTSNETNRENIGEPLVMHLPSEAVIPVFTPGNEEQHVGYFVLLDMEGNPVSKANVEGGYNDLQKRLNSQSTNMSSGLLQKAQSLFGDDCKSITLQQASQIYADIIEADLLARLRNGVYGKNLSLAKNEEIYRLMLARALKSQFTQLLFVPIELMTYYAYKFDNRGIGKSLNDDLRILNSIRAMALFTKLAAQLKNSIGRTEVNVELDPNDPNPQTSIEKIIHEIGRTRQANLPLGITSPSDLADWVQKANMQFAFSNHPGLPEVKIQFNELNTSYVEPSTDLEDDLRKRAIMAVGLNPETVDNGFSAEFATTIVENNILLSKRVLQIQEKFLPLVTDNIRKVISNDGRAIHKFKEIIESNFDKIRSNLNDVDITDENKDVILDLLVQEFLSNFEATLPKPNNITLENQMSAYDTYAEALDKVIENFISSNVMPSSLVGEEVNQKVEEIKTVVKHAYLRRFMIDNNILPELFEMMTYDDKGIPLFDLEDVQRNHTNDMTKAIVKLFDAAKPIAEAANKDLQNSGVADTSSTSPTDTSSDSTSGGASGAEDDLGLDGDMDFGLPSI